MSARRHIDSSRPDTANVYGRVSQRQANEVRQPVTARGREMSERTRDALMRTIGRPFV